MSKSKPNRLELKDSFISKHQYLLDRLRDARGDATFKPRFLADLILPSNVTNICVRGGGNDEI